MWLPAFVASRRITSHAQMSAAARWNCWAVSRRSVWRMTIATVAAVEASDLALQAPNGKGVGTQAEVGFGLPPPVRTRADRRDRVQNVRHLPDR